MASQARIESNKWLRRHAPQMEGVVLSVGSRDDRDGEGGRYRDYFTQCARYRTSEVEPWPDCDLVLDIRSMPHIADASFDCVFCSGVLEHVDDVGAAVSELTRVLKPGGVLLLGLPFRQSIHLAPHDYWRFTEFGIRVMLGRAGYAIEELCAIDESVPDFPASYWTKAVRDASGERAV